MVLEVHFSLRAGKCAGVENGVRAQFETLLDLAKYDGTTASIPACTDYTGVNSWLKVSGRGKDRTECGERLRPRPNIRSWLCGFAADVGVANFRISQSPELFDLARAYQGWKLVVPREWEA